MKKDTITKEELIRAIQECAAELGHPPSMSELKGTKGVHERQIKKHFATYKQALAECGMKREGGGYKVPEEELFRDWAEVVRKLKKIPNVAEYELNSKYSQRPLVSRFGTWGQAKIGLLALAETRGWDVDWKDVVDVLREHLKYVVNPDKTSRRRPVSFSEIGIFKDRPIYGPPVVRIPLAHGPTNESGVLFLFGAVAEALGFVVTRLQMGFPDCEAMYEVAPGIWQRIRIELEHESKNFLAHQHRVDGCDLIVCWIHNWPDCPVPVIELSKELPRIMGMQKVG